MADQEMMERETEHEKVQRKAKPNHHHSAPAHEKKARSHQPSSTRGGADNGGQSSLSESVYGGEEESAAGDASGEEIRAGEGGEGEEIQRAADGGEGGNDGEAEQAVAAAGGGGGESVAEPIRRKVEHATGADLSGVRVHTGAASQRASEAVHAKAYTKGQNIHFAAGQYQPGTTEGDHLIAHELVHTVQQRGGTQKRQNKLKVSQPGDAAEVEADRIADSVVSSGATSHKAQNSVSGGDKGLVMRQRATYRCRANANATVRTHRMGLTRECMKEGETFTGTRFGDWVWGKSGSGVTGWVLWDSLRNRKPVNMANPAGPPQERTGMPRDYVNGRDRKNHPGSSGEKFHYSTPCPVKKDARLFRDIQLDIQTGVEVKAGETISVRYARKHVICVFRDGWRFMRADAVDLKPLRERLKKLHNPNARD